MARSLALLCAVSLLLGCGDSTVEFKASDTSIESGETILLSWEVEVEALNPETLSYIEITSSSAADPIEHSTSSRGVIERSPTTSTDYTLKAVFGGTGVREEEDSLTVSVNTSTSNLVFADSVLQSCVALEGSTAFDVTHLNCENVADLSGVEALVLMQTMDIQNGQLVDLTALQNLTELREIDLSNNAIISVLPLQDLTRLEVLNLADNNIEDHIDDLVDLVNLIELDLTGNDNLPCAEVDTLTDTLTTLDVTLPDHCL